MRLHQSYRTAALFTGLLLLAALSVPLVLSDTVADWRHGSLSTRNESEASTQSPAVCVSTIDVVLRCLHDQFDIAPESVSLEDEFSSLKELVERQFARSQTEYHRTTLEEFVAIGRNQSRAGLLTGPDDSLAVVTGVVIDDLDRPCLQILESESASRLMPAERLQVAGLSEVWISADTEPEATVLTGSTVARVDHLLIPLGLIKPSFDVPAQFRISNTGDQPLVIDRIEPSCGCTAVKPDRRTEIAAGETQQFQVRVGSGDSGSCVHHVDLTLFEKGTGESQNLRVTVCGNVLDSYQIKPRSLDFGAVDAGGSEPIVRLVRVTESELEQTDILSASADGGPLRLTIESAATDGDAQREHVVRAILDPRELSPGQMRGEIVLNTNSARRPTAIIPFECQVRPSIDAVPEVASFGRVLPGQPTIEQIIVSARRGAIKEAALAACPEWISCDLLRQQDEIRLKLTATAARTGYRFGRVHLNLTTESGSEELVIPCSLFVQQAKGSHSP